MNLVEPLLAELRIEAATTRRMLERVPDGSLDWRPHEKSRTLGELAAHIAGLPGMFLAPLDQDGFDRSSYIATPKCAAEFVGVFDANVAAAAKSLAALTDDRMLGPWRYSYAGHLIFEQPRLVVARSAAMNHLVHHRGQLSVYLRLLGVPLPSIYGPTADGA